MLLCVHISVMLARILTTSALRSHQPRLFHRPAAVSVCDVSCTARLGVQLYFTGVICRLRNLQFQGFGIRSFHFDLYLLVGEEINICHLWLSSIKETSQWHWGKQPNWRRQQQQPFVCLSLNLSCFFSKRFQWFPHLTAATGRLPEGIDAAAPVQWRVLLHYEREKLRRGTYYF